MSTEKQQTQETEENVKNVEETSEETIAAETTEAAESAETTETSSKTAEKVDQISDESLEQVENTELTETPTEEKVAVSEIESDDEIHTFTGELSEKVYTLDELQTLADEDDYSETEYNELVNLYESTLSDLKEKDIVKGRVVGLDEKYVIVDIGFKSEGIVPLNEFRSTDEVKPGDEIEVFLDRVEDREGQLVLSRRKADTLRTWQNIEHAFESQGIIEGLIKRRIKGGMVVDIYGIDAFLPGSQIDVRPVRDFDAYVGKTMEFMVVKLNMSSENVVVSHRAIVESDLEDQREEILSTIETGQILEGHVKNITDFGVFIDLGGVDGLLHITDLSWGRVDHPSEIVHLDQNINVVVLDFDDNSKRISLGLKQLEPHPWDEIDFKYPENMRVQGKVVSIADYGAFIELEKGVEGLVHISEMSWTQHIKHPSQLVEKNEVIECVVLNVNKDEKKISLGVKQLEEDPWQNLLDRYPINSKHKGIVRNLTNFGVFIELEPGIDGLIHISDLSWEEKVAHPSEIVKKDQEIDVVVLAVDFENRRITLGHKQVMENPWEQYAEEYAKGTDVEGEITRFTDKGAFVRLPLGVEAFFPGSQAEREGQMNQSYKGGEKLTLKVIDFDEGDRSIILSEKALNDPDFEAPKKSRKKKVKQSEVTGATTLGEMSGLADLKKLMDQEEEQGKEEK